MRPMRTLSLLSLTMVTALGAGGCFISTSSNNPPVNNHGGLGGPLPSGAPVHSILAGAGVTVAPGQQAGYAITANSGGSYRFFWTGDSKVSGTYSEFWGTVWTAGNFTSITPGCAGGICALEADDFVGTSTSVNGGNEIDFDTFATDGLDGFDFVVDTQPVYFNMVIDGTAYPSLVFFTDASSGQIANPAALPFGLTVQ